MPTYAYECTGCGHSFEAFQKMSDSPLTLCEACGGALKKLMFPVGIMFKGPGFYVNDYAKKSGGESKSESSSSESSSSKASDSAPAAETKTESKADTSAKEAATTTPKPAETKTTA